MAERINGIVNSFNFIFVYFNDSDCKIVSIDELDLYDAKLALRIAAMLGPEEVELSCGGLSHLHDTTEGILVLTGTSQTDGDFVSLDMLSRLQVHIT